MKVLGKPFPGGYEKASGRGCRVWAGWEASGETEGYGGGRDERGMAI